LEQADCPILQTIFASAEQSAWEASARGLGPRDLAMHIALPEVDGRIFTRAVAFKAAAPFDHRTECSIVVPKVLHDRVSFVSELAANWAKLGRTAVAERRVALVLANYPNKDGRIGNGVGLDTPASAAAILNALSEAGYATGDAPTNGAALTRQLTEGVTNSPPFTLDLSNRLRQLSRKCSRGDHRSLGRSRNGPLLPERGLPAADPPLRQCRGRGAARAGL
jgi:cobaltochelatase CobN